MVEGRRKATIEKERRERLAFDAAERKQCRHDRDPDVRRYRREKKRGDRNAARVIAEAKQAFDAMFAEWAAQRSVRSARAKRASAAAKAKRQVLT